MFSDKQQIFSLLDLTSLSDSDTESSIIALCQKAITPEGHVAAVCIYPRFVKTVKATLPNDSVKIATVVNFPYGTDSLTQTLQLIQQAIQDGANEIDVVFPYEQFLAGDRAGAKDFIQQCKMACSEAVLLKVIVETGALQSPEQIMHVTQDVIEAGADFIKTSTGKIKIGATLEAAEIILAVIKNAKRNVGFKVSGGVRTIEQAEQYIALASSIMGSDWVTARMFRIGASQLVDALGGLGSRH